MHELDELDSDPPTLELTRASPTCSNYLPVPAKSRNKIDTAGSCRRMRLPPAKLIATLYVAALSFLGGQAIGHITAGSAKMSLATSAAANVSASEGWRFVTRHSIAILSTEYAPVAYYVPDAPRHVLVLAFGYPWPDRTASNAKILSYARMNLVRWTQFADRTHILLIAPALGGTNFFDFRALGGRLIGADIFVNALLDGPANRVIPGLGGRFCLYGHSAGAQFAARYVIAHPERLQCTVLSAPSTYPMPSTSAPWPFGMAHLDGGVLPGIGPKNWIEAATDAPITVIIGSDDLERRPEAPGQVGETRLSRGRAWVESMQALATSHRRASEVSFTEIACVDHDESSMAKAARRVLERFYSAPSNHAI